MKAVSKALKKFYVVWCGRQLSEIKKVHKKYPFWRDLALHYDFRNWLSHQDPDIKKLADSVLAEDAIKLIGRYLVEKQGSRVRRTDQSR